MGVSKNSGKTPKMDGLFHGKSYFLMDDLGVPVFLETPILDPEIWTKFLWQPKKLVASGPNFHPVDFFFGSENLKKMVPIRQEANMASIEK